MLKFRNMARLFILIIIFLTFLVKSSEAFWVWTPETNKWVNPKYSVKETPQEQLKYGLEFYDSKDYKEAMREFSKLIKHYPRAREAPEAQFYLALCYEEQNKLYEAFKNYQMVVDKYPFSERSGEIVQKQYDIGIKILENLNDRNKFVDAISGTDYDLIDIFKTVIKNGPYGKLAAASQYKIGQYLLEKQLYQEARDEFEKVINDYPDSEWAKAAQYQIALSDAKRSTAPQYDQKITSAAVKQFEDFVEVNPDVDLSEKAKEQIQQLREKEAENNFIIAQFYEKQKNYQAAKTYYQSVANDYQNTTWATKALEKIREVSSRIQ